MNRAGSAARIGAGSQLVASALALALAVPALAGDDARAILAETEARHRTRSQQYAGELEVVSKEGKVRKKGWRSFREGYAGDAKQLIRFVAPPEVRGVGFLSLGRAGKSPDQWLYLPSMKRERRIASQDRDASFVGTDFNYEDMEEFDHTAHDVALRGEEALDGRPCFVIEVRPRQASLYERKTLWVRKDILFLVRVDFVRKGESEPAKRFLLSDVEQLDGHWVARKWEMANLRTGSRTTVLLQELAFDRPNPPDRFTLHNLKGLRYGDGLVKAELTDNLTDAWSLTAALDVPFGPRQGPYGARPDSRRARLGIRWSW